MCTEIGCESGLVVNLEGSPPGPWSVSVSSQGSSFAQDCASTVNCGPQLFPNFLPALVSVTITRGANSVTYHNLTPTQRTVHPNGPRCAPSCNQPFVTVAPPPP